MEVKVTKEIAASPQIVFDLIAKGNLFFDTGILPGSFAMDFKPDGKFSFEWISGGFCQGTFQKIEKNKHVLFSWNSYGCPHPDDNDTVVDIKLEENSIGTLLTLKHTGFKTKESCDSHTEGWTSSLKDFASSAPAANKYENYDWSRFHVIMNIKSTPEKLFKRWATSGGIESFFVSKADFRTKAKTVRDPQTLAEAGDRFSWSWPNGSSTYGRVLNIEQNKSMRFTFGQSEVCVEFKPSEDGTWLHIEQSQIPTDSHSRAAVHLNCRTGWTYFAAVLKALEETNQDVRDKNPKSSHSLAWLNGFPQ